MSAQPQPSLFDAPSIARGSKTSAAGSRAAAHTAGTKRAAILECIEESKSWGRTRAELAERTGIPLATVCSCVFKLRKDADIETAVHTRDSAAGVKNEVADRETAVPARRGNGSRDGAHAQGAHGLAKLRALPRRRLNMSAPVPQAARARKEVNGPRATGSGR